MFEYRINSWYYYIYSRGPQIPLVLIDLIYSITKNNLHKLLN